MTFVLLLSACQSPKSNVTGDSVAPSHTFCNGHIAWSAEVQTDELMDYTTFWIAFDAATVQDSFKYIHVDVTVDGKSVAEQMKYMGIAEPYSVTCTESGQQFEASRVKYTLFLPALSPGEHSIRWTYTMTADIDDGEFDYPSGMTAEDVITINAQY